jgi:hypothetical protein
MSLKTFDTADYYWQVGDQRTFSKQQAIIWAGGDVGKIHYYFMDDLWDAQDWTQKPKHTVHELMATRCRQLRSQYKNVRVAYSGGYDSQGIIDAFAGAGIPVDSVMIRIKNYKVTQENKIAVEQARVLQNTIWPNLKIETIELEANDFYKFYQQHKDDWIVQPAGGYEPWFYKVNLSFLENYNHDFQRARDNYVTQNTCDVYGIEKPRLWIENGAWYAAMIDKTLNWVANTSVEGFYISRNLPELHIAQTWGMLDWIESQPFTTHNEVHEFLHSVQSHKLGWDIYRDWNLAIGRGMVLNIHSYQGGGTKGYNSGNPRDNKGCQDLMAEARKTHQTAIDTWEGVLGDFETQYANAIDSNGEIAGCWSKKYYIKPVEPGRLYRNKQ